MRGYGLALIVGGIAMLLSLSMVQDRALAGFAVGFCVWQVGLALLIAERTNRRP
jgi:hypothetical protein